MPADADTSHSGSRATGEPLLISIHIPKTGGTTLLRVLHRHFGNRLQTCYGPGANPGSVIDCTDGPPACLHGHQVFRCHRELAGSRREEHWITFLRDPLACAVSYYYFAHKSLNKDPARPGFEDRGLTAWLLNTEPRRWPFPPGYPFNQFGSYIDRSGRTLEQLDFVGVTERFDESMFLMYHALGWTPIHYRQNNKGDYRPPVIEPAVARRFREINAADYALYDQACRLLDQRREAYGPGFSGDFDRFRQRLT